SLGGSLQVHGHLRLQRAPRRVSTSASVLSPRFCFCSASAGPEDLFSSASRRPTLQALRPKRLDMQTGYDRHSAFASRPSAITINFLKKGSLLVPVLAAPFAD